VDPFFAKGTAGAEMKPKRLNGHAIKTSLESTKANGTFEYKK